MLEKEDILQERQYATYHILSILLDACEDELEVLVADEPGEWNVMQRIRRRVEQLFGPRESIARKIRLDRFVEKHLETLRPRFTHRYVSVARAGLIFQYITRNFELYFCHRKNACFLGAYRKLPLKTLVLSGEFYPVNEHFGKFWLWKFSPKFRYPINTRNQKNVK